MAVTILNVLVLFVGFLSILTNGVLLFITLRDPLKCFMRRSTTFFIISLAVADMMTGAFEFVMEINTMYPSQLTEMKTYTYPVSWISTQVSFLTLLAMSVERFLIVRYPFDSRRWITKRRIIVSIALIWLVAVILGSLIHLPQPEQAYVQFTIFIIFLLSIILIVVFYTIILLNVRKSKKTLSITGQMHAGAPCEMRNAMPSPRLRSSEREASKTTDQSSVALLPADSTTNGKMSSAKLGNASRNGQPGSPRCERHGDESPIHEYNSRVGENRSRTCGKKNPLQRNECPVHEHESPVQEGKDPVDVDRSPVMLIRAARKSDIESDALAGSNRSKMSVTGRLRQHQQENKLTAVVFLLVGVLIVTVLPYLFATQIYVGYTIFCKCPPMAGLHEFMLNYYPIELLNFAVNPLIYAWRLPQYRRTLRYFCRCGWRRHDMRGSQAYSV